MENTVTRRRMKEGARRAAVKGGGGVDGWWWRGHERRRTLPGDMTSEIKDGEGKDSKNVIERSAMSFWHALLALHFSLCFVGRD